MKIYWGDSVGIILLLAVVAACFLFCLMGCNSDVTNEYILGVSDIEDSSIVINMDGSISGFSSSYGVTVPAVEEEEMLI
jgi:hypothetical protein